MPKNVDEIGNCEHSCIEEKQRRSHFSGPKANKTTAYDRCQPLPELYNTYNTDCTKMNLGHLI